MISSSLFCWVLAYFRLTLSLEHALWTVSVDSKCQVCIGCPLITMLSVFSLKNVKLSAEVEPFVPQKIYLDAFVLPMALPSDNGSVSGVEPTPIPSYLITCYPFVQENQSNR